MSRTVELGRAVIALQSASIELWLTTLITLSPDANNHLAQHSSLDIHSLEPNALLEYLSSGKVWVGRGNGMHMSFNLSKLAKPPSSHCLRQLGDSIVDAPAWKQFGLRLSFPLNYQPTQENLRINVDHCREKDQSPTTANHSSIANSDVRPPEGIPQIFLESVEFVIATFDTRSRSAARKRPKRESTQQKAGASQPDASVNDVTSLPGKAYGSNQCLKFSDLGWADADQEGNDVHETRDTARRSLTSPNFDTNSGWPQAFTYHSKRKQPVTESELHVVHVSDHTSESAQLAGLVDAVLRLSICLNLRGSISNLRVKANTFLYGLTNIAPALWRIGYLITCSPAMYTNPTLGRSLGRINIAARSTDLKAKIRALGSGPSNVRREQGVAGYDCVRHMASAITDRLWIHIQRSQLSKPMSGSIQSMCDPEFEGSSTEDPAELLEEHTSTNRSGCQDSNAGLETPVLPPREQLRGPLYSENLDTEPRLSQLHPAVYYLGSDIMETSCTRYNNRKPDAIPDTFDMVTLMHQSSESQHRSSSASSSSLGSPLSADHISHDVSDGEIGLLFNCGSRFDHTTLDQDQLCFHKTSTDVERASDMSLPLVDDEDLLFHI